MAANSWVHTTVTRGTNITHVWNSRVFQRFRKQVPTYVGCIPIGGMYVCDFKIPQAVAEPKFNVSKCAPSFIPRTKVSLSNGLLPNIGDIDRMNPALTSPAWPQSWDFRKCDKWYQ